MQQNDKIKHSTYEVIACLMATFLKIKKIDNNNLVYSTKAAFSNFGSLRKVLSSIPKFIESEYCRLDVFFSKICKIYLKFNASQKFWSFYIDLKK